MVINVECMAGGGRWEDLQKEVMLDCFFFFSKLYTSSGAMTASI
jgi:hypothetical protein